MKAAQWYMNQKQTDFLGLKIPGYATLVPTLCGSYSMHTMDFHQVTSYLEQELKINHTALLDLPNVISN